MPAPLGVDTVQTATNFLQDGDMVLKCGWNDKKHCFEFMCRHDIADAAQYLFLKAMMELIAEEEGKNGLKSTASKRKRRGSNGSDSDTDDDSDSDADAISDFDSGYLGPIINESSPVSCLYPSGLHIR